MLAEGLLNHSAEKDPGHQDRKEATDEEAERIAAFVSAVLCSIESDAETLGFDSLRRLTLWAGKGRIVIVPMGQFALVIAADSDTDLTYALMEVPGLARSLMRRSKIEIDS